jgi:trigger factor
LETSVEKLEGNRVRLTVTLTANEVDRAIAGAYSRTASQVRIPGFRSGKAPRPIIDTHVGRERVLATALEGLVEDFYPKALTAERVRPIEQPDVGTLDGLVPGEPYTFSAEFDARPQLTLSSVEGLKISAPPVKTSDREVDAQIDYMRDRFATLEPVEDRGVADGDFALISFIGTIDGEPYEGNVVDKYLYEIGRGQMPAEFDASMVGAKPGETVTASFPVPETTESPEYLGKTAGFEITIHEVKSKVLPEIDGDFAANAGGYSGVDEMREDIRTSLDGNKAAGRVRELERDARAALSERLVGDVPEAMITSMTSQMFEEFFQSLSERGITMEKYVEATGVAPERIRDDIAVEAAVRVKNDLALEALFVHAGLEISDAEIADELSKLAEEQKTDTATLMQRLSAAGLMPLVIEDLTHRKAVRWLMENVELVEVEEGEAAPGKKTRKASKPKADAAAAKKAPKTAAKKAPKAPAKAAAPKKKTSKPDAGKEE